MSGSEEGEKEEETSHHRLRGPLLWAEMHEGELLIVMFREEEASEDGPEGTGTPGLSKVW